MILIVGLGNPGKKYKKTRHNIGSRVLDEFQKENSFPFLKFSQKLNSLISEGKIGRKKILLVKPQTFMNKSGQVVKALTTHYPLKTTNLIVIHDDIDLSLGKIRISKGRGSAGHKGVESIIKELRTKNFVRFRIGIQPKKGKPKNPEKFVLQKFFKTEEKIVKKIIKTTCDALKTALTEGIEKAMNKFNK